MIVVLINSEAMMKNKQGLMLVIGLILALSYTITLAQEKVMQKEMTMKRMVTREHQVNYLLFLPKGYDQETDKKWPLILFLHGMGERGSDLSLVKKHGPPKIVETKPDFQFVVVSPQCPIGSSWNNEDLIALLDEVCEKFKIDTNRVYLTGLSMGGFGTWSLGLAYPERFAAIAPICGGGCPFFPVVGYDQKRADLVKSMGIWAFHGAKDPVVKLEESERMVNFLKTFGCKDVKLTVYPEAQHDSWTETYNNPELYEWFLKHSR